MVTAWHVQQDCPDRRQRYAEARTSIGHRPRSVGSATNPPARAARSSRAASPDRRPHRHPRRRPAARRAQAGRNSGAGQKVADPRGDHRGSGQHVPAEIGHHQQVLTAVGLDGGRPTVSLLPQERHIPVGKAAQPSIQGDVGGRPRRRPARTSTPQSTRGPRSPAGRTAAVHAAQCRRRSTGPSRHRRPYAGCMTAPTA